VLVKIREGISIPEAELQFSFSRSSGPGGQNVNKVETKVRLKFDVVGSPSLSETDKEKVMERLASRISSDGALRLSSQRHRTREANRKEVLERFQQLMRRALEVRKPRRQSRVPKAERRRRLADKRRRSKLKESRSRPSSNGD
jgi:ribosome-associated protein